MAFTWKKRARRKIAMVEFEVVQALQEFLGFKSVDMAALCGLSESQFRRYRNQGLMPIEKYLMAKDGIKAELLDEVLAMNEKIKQLDEIGVTKKL